MIRDFDKLQEWDSRLFSIEGLIENSTKKSRASSLSRPVGLMARYIKRSMNPMIWLSNFPIDIPIRNCSTGRDLSFTLKKFADAARQSYKEFKNLYARDLHCPEAWMEQCRVLLPLELQWGGRLDLFQWLPSCARSEVMMAYVGSEGSS